MIVFLSPLIFQPVTPFSIFALAPHSYSARKKCTFLIDDIFCLLFQALLERTLRSLLGDLLADPYVIPGAGCAEAVLISTLTQKMRVIFKYLQSCLLIVGFIKLHYEMTRLRLMNEMAILYLVPG